jgi:hypothetical protein
MDAAIYWLASNTNWTHRPTWPGNHDSWCRKNIVMMDALKTEFAAERNDPNVRTHYDDYWLSLFLWWVAVYKADNWNERDVYADNRVLCRAP